MNGHSRRRSAAPLPQRLRHRAVHDVHTPFQQRLRATPLMPQCSAVSPVPVHARCMLHPQRPSAMLCIPNAQHLPMCQMPSAKSPMHAQCVLYFQFPSFKPYLAPWPCRATRQAATVPLCRGG